MYSAAGLIWRLGSSRPGNGFHDLDTLSKYLTSDKHDNETRALKKINNGCNKLLKNIVMIDVLCKFCAAYEVWSGYPETSPNFLKQIVCDSDSYFFIQEHTHPICAFIESIQKKFQTWTLHHGMSRAWKSCTTIQDASLKKKGRNRKSCNCLKQCLLTELGGGAKNFPSGTPSQALSNWY